MKILMLAGEESGLIYARELESRLSAIAASRGMPAPAFRGYASEGFKTADLAVMGFGPVLRRIFYFMRVARTMKNLVRSWRPDAVVTIDYPGLNLRLAAFAKSLGIPAIHVVCPQVWAWRKNRIPKIAAALSKLLCFFPFEPALFQNTGLQAKFIGHPLVDISRAETESAAPATHPPRRRTLALLPGSRIGEIRRILPTLLDATAELAERGRLHRLDVSIPAANSRARAEIDRIIAARRLPHSVSIKVQSGNARELLKRADCAAVASGTATLEAALMRCPTVLVYSVSPLLAWFARRVIKDISHVGLANIIAEKCGAVPPMPELLQEAFTPSAVAARLNSWLSDPSARADASAALDSVMLRLSSSGNAIQNAAEEILSSIPAPQKS